MRRETRRICIVLLALVVALSGALPAALSAVHRHQACPGPETCHICRVAEAGLLLARLFLLAPLCASLLRSLLLCVAHASARGDLFRALTPVARKVRMNN